jgi:hypothetical protein
VRTKRSGIFFLSVSRQGLTAVAAGNSTAVGLDAGGERAAGRRQTGGGASPRPPRPDGGSRASLERRERQGVLELGVLRRARTRKKLSRKLCLGGRVRYCASFRSRMAAFYRRERAGKEVAEGGGPGGVRHFHGGCGVFGSMLACAASSCGVITSLLACWIGQRRGREVEGKERGPVALPPPFVRVTRPGSGQGDGESTEESLGGS